MITEEMAAIDWAVAPQRVTVAGADATVVGWCEGVSVELEIQQGRMNRWRQRELVRAPRAVAQTPDEWREFAEVNAQLAARLIGRA